MFNDDIIEQIKETNHNLEIISEQIKELRIDIISEQIRELKKELKEQLEHIAKMCS